MSNIKTLRNDTGSPIPLDDVGRIIIQPAENFIIPVPKYVLFADSLDVETPITAGDLVVTNGTVDLTPALGKLYLKFPHNAQNLFFTAAGFTAKDVKNAIIEAKNAVAGTSEKANNLYNSIGEPVANPEFMVFSVGTLGTTEGEGLFIVVAERGTGPPTSEIAVRLYNVSDATELAVLIFTEGEMTRKEIAFTLPGANKIVEVHACKDLGVGTIYSAEVR